MAEEASRRDRPAIPGCKGREELGDRRVEGEQALFDQVMSTVAVNSLVSDATSKTDSSRIATHIPAGSSVPLASW